jgi:hypothetical protein
MLDVSEQYSYYNTLSKYYNEQNIAKNRNDTP